MNVHEDVALPDAFFVQGGEASCGQRFAKTFASERRRNGQMMQISAPSIVAAKHRANDLGINGRNKAHAGIALEKRRHSLLGVGIAQPDSLSQSPQGKGVVIVGHLEFAYGGFAQSGHVPAISDLIFERFIQENYMHGR
jgi:hypothetical protein